MSIENQNATENPKNNDQLIDIGNGDGFFRRDPGFDPGLTSGMSEGLQPAPQPVWNTDRFGLTDPSMTLENASRLAEQSKRNHELFLRQIGGMAAAGS